MRLTSGTLQAFLRRTALTCLGMLALVSVAHAGQIYGSVTASGKGVGNAAIEIDCGNNKNQGSTAPDGSYRISVPQPGQCTLRMPAYPNASAVVFSYPNPSQYDFELSGPVGGSYTLRRR